MYSALETPTVLQDTENRQCGSHKILFAIVELDPNDGSFAESAFSSVGSIMGFAEDDNDWTHSCFNGISTASQKKKNAFIYWRFIFILLNTRHEIVVSNIL